MSDPVLIIKVASDAVDNMILLVAQIAMVMSTFSTGISIVLLIDYFKRHGWQYKKKKAVVSKHEHSSSKHSQV